MQDPFAWSIPCGRVFGITIRIHILFPFLALAMIMRAGFEKTAPDGAWIDAAAVMALLFVSVLLHEFGHCFAARGVNGDASEVLIWPLGGLANCDVPHTPRANFLVAAAGPAVNLFLATLAGLALWAVASAAPAWSLKGYLGRSANGMTPIPMWSGGHLNFPALSGVVLLEHFFWVNYVLFLLNVVLVGFPLDGGRMLQAALWPRMGYRRATLAAVYAGFVVMLLVGLYSFIDNEVMFLALALFIYLSCKQQWIILETGGEESLFGYDFSQGYTSLERDEPPTPAKPRQSWWQRWKQQRAERKAKEEAANRESEETRLDELLDKVARQGLESLTDEERRFMQRVSDRYRNKNRG
jgi:Zn-dependent protease